MTPLLQSALLSSPQAAHAARFHEKFASPKNHQKKFIFGRNIYTDSLIRHLRVAGIIDEYCEDKFYQGIPVYRLSHVPGNALVLNAAGGRPLTVRKKLDNLKIENIDVFEPEPANFRTCSENLAALPNVHLHCLGVGHQKTRMFIEASGSASRVSTDAGRPTSLAYRLRRVGKKPGNDRSHRERRSCGIRI